MQKGDWASPVGYTEDYSLVSLLEDEPGDEEL